MGVRNRTKVCAGSNVAKRDLVQTLIHSTWWIWALVRLGSRVKRSLWEMMRSPEDA